jgi:hypothetical protein
MKDELVAEQLDFTVLQRKQDKLLTGGIKEKQGKTSQ